MPGITSNALDVLDAVDLPIIVIGRDCRIVRINRASTTALGLAASDIGGSAFGVVAGFENLQTVLEQVIADGVPCRREMQIGERSFLVRVAPYAESGGQLSGAVLTFTNVTAFRASIEQAVYEREYTKAILNTVIDPLVVLNAQLQIQTANRAFYAMFGVSRDQTQGVSIRKLGAEDWETSDVWKSIETAVSLDTPFQSVEIDREFPSIGKRTLVLGARRLARDDDAQVLVTFQDVTERKQAEQALRDSEERLRAIVETTPECVKLIAADGTLLHMNAAGLAIIGAESPDVVLGKSIYDLVAPEFRDRFREFSESICQGEKGSLEFDILGLDGRRRHMETHAAPLRRPEGGFAHLALTRDVSDQKQAQEALLTSEHRFRKLSESLDAQVRDRTREIEERNAEVLRQSEQLRELSWELLHTQDKERRRIARELHDSAGQTLAVLAMNLSMVIETLQEKAPEIVEAAQQTEELVQQLSKDIRTTSYLLHPPLLDENGLPAALSWYISGLADRSGLDIAFNISEEFGRLPREMEFVIFRLVQECVTNIHRHSGSKTAVIQVVREQDRILVEVRDQGKGMSAEKLAEVQGKGSGVGIRGMRERLRQFQGEMIIHSTDAGTTVVVTVPISNERMAIPQHRRPAVEFPV